MIDLIRFVNYDIHEIENTDINLMEHHIFLEHGFVGFNGFCFASKTSPSQSVTSVFKINISVFIEHDGSIRKSTG